jgi:hypothetical protein
MDADFVSFEVQLRSLHPSAVPITRDQVIFTAGEHAGSRHAWRKCRFWSASGVAASLLIGGIMGVLMARPEVMKKGRDIATHTQSSHEPLRFGFSGIQNVDSWSREELQKRGISVRSWKHAIQTEDPPLDWVEITFDTTRAPANQGILMTAWLVSDGVVSDNASRTHTESVDVKSLVLLVSVAEGYRANSYVNIVIWKAGADGGSEAQGYKLSAKRMIELAGGM